MKKTLLIFVSFICTISLTCISTFAATYYVDAARSNDSGDGRSWATAKKTLQAGINLMTTAGDVLRVKTGTYAGAYIYNKVGSSWNTGGHFLVRSDDGSGNYNKTGVVITGGDYGTPWRTAPLGVEDCSYWKFEYMTFTGNSANGNEFSFIAEGVSVQNTSPRTGIWVDNCILNGSPSEQSFYAVSLNDVRLSNSVATCTNCNSGDGAMVLFLTDSSANNFLGGHKVYNNDIYGTHNLEYGMVTFIRVNGVDFYNNYLHDARSNELLCLRHTNNANVYNNVFRLGGSYWNPRGGYANWVIWLRGMTACVSGNNGFSGCQNVRIFNNTIDKAGYAYDAFVVMNDTVGAIIENNFILGSVDYLIDQYDSVVKDNASCPSCTWANCPNYRARNNVFRNNYATGSCIAVENPNGTSDYKPSDYGWTLSGNSCNIGTTMVNLSGNRPSPYYDLKASYDGFVNGLSSDFDGNARSSPPDVGAYEYGTGGATTTTSIQPDTTPPAAPTGLRIIE